MAKMTRLGELERAVMDHLWSSGEPQTVRQVHEALSAQRSGFACADALDEMHKRGLSAAGVPNLVERVDHEACDQFIA
ncbi:MAG TPA: BlaI/MecI/CopY family transcriptional regulator, partial [Mycobacterium sp.]|nr:BlaI/MecI/CopY family transcriptional regulator [Mycobacterium sp.]